ncbi:hypothetical protein LRS10_16110 [Phenylobacterium sp. J426]|uniref:hypothetical protein n=1 Tax=Phenylobacterium sp. J426 TaxID=2898439 RepID=UPI002151E04B|nr:hypothetical protein [Phenylobacterium sp. J426]MCR5875566.1 hypothetical protein [Phenylobacterium sp. J426]
MPARTSRKPKPSVTLKDAFETEFARREMERRAREEAERLQQEQDLAKAEALFDAINSDAKFLKAHGLTVDRRRYTVSVDHANFRIAAYFEDGQASVTSADKRFASPGAATPRKQESVATVEDAVRIIAQFLADEIR